MSGPWSLASGADAYIDVEGPLQASEPTPLSTIYSDQSEGADQVERVGY